MQAGLEPPNQKVGKVSSAAIYITCGCPRRSQTFSFTFVQLSVRPSSRELVPHPASFAQRNRSPTQLVCGADFMGPWIAATAFMLVLLVTKSNAEHHEAVENVIAAHQRNGIFAQCLPAFGHPDLRSCREAIRSLLATILVARHDSARYRMGASWFSNRHAKKMRSSVCGR